MNTESVGWRVKLEEGYVYSDKPYGDAEPLYTHPAKELDEQFKKGFEAGKEEGWKAHKFHHPAKTLDRELLDKTIIDQQNEIKELRKNLDVARAILRKAQE